MSEEDNKAMLRRWFDEVWNKQNAAAIDELMAADAVVHGLSDDENVQMRGPADFKPFHETFRGAFPNIQVVVEDMVAEGDMVAARLSVRATHRGDQLGIAASNADTSFTGMVFARVGDGKFVEAWNNFDFMTMNKQIGVI